MLMMLMKFRFVPQNFFRFFFFQNQDQDQVFNIKINNKSYALCFKNTHQIWCRSAKAGITSEAAKFSHAMLALDVRYTVEVEDIILNPHAPHPFTTLRETLTKRLSASQEEKTHELLEKSDRRPQTLSVSIRTIWISRLPANIQAILATQENQILNQVADLADTIASPYKSNAQQL